jgi:hypothetical protein
MTVKNHIEATKKRLAEAAAARRQKSQNGSTRPENAKSKSLKPQGRAQRPNVRPTGRGR